MNEQSPLSRNLSRELHRRSGGSGVPLPWWVGASKSHNAQACRTKTVSDRSNVQQGMVTHHHNILLLLRHALALKKGSAANRKKSSRQLMLGRSSHVRRDVPVLVELEAGDNDVGRVDANHDGLSVALLPVHTLDVDHPLLAVDLHDLSLTTLVGSTNNEDLIILADGD